MPARKYRAKYHEGEPQMRWTETEIEAGRALMAAITEAAELVGRKKATEVALRVLEDVRSGAADAPGYMAGLIEQTRPLVR